MARISRNSRSRRISRKNSRRISRKNSKRNNRKTKLRKRSRRINRKINKKTTKNRKQSTRRIMRGGAFPVTDDPAKDLAFLTFILGEMSDESWDAAMKENTVNTSYSDEQREWAAWLPSIKGKEQTPVTKRDYSTKQLNDLQSILLNPTGDNPIGLPIRFCRCLQNFINYKWECIQEDGDLWGRLSAADWPYNYRTEFEAKKSGAEKSGAEKSGDLERLEKLAVADNETMKGLKEDDIMKVLNFKGFEIDDGLYEKLRQYKGDEYIIVRNALFNEKIVELVERFPKMKKLKVFFRLGYTKYPNFYPQPT